MSEEDRAFNYLANSLRETLKGHIGEPVSEDSKARIQANIKKLTDAIMDEQKALHAMQEVGAVSAQFIRQKLEQSSVVPSILPAVRGPFVPWREDDNVTHWSCFLGDIPIEQHVRLCDFRAILMGAACEGEAISCLSCLTAPEAVDL